MFLMSRDHTARANIPQRPGGGGIEFCSQAGSPFKDCSLSAILKFAALSVALN
jgi:hypothetical protein